VRATKDSGVEWLGQIPADWEVKPGWSYFRRVKQTGFDSEELLSVYRDHGVIPKSSRDDNHNVESEDLGSYQLVEVGDMVMNKMKAWQGSIALSNFRGIVSPAYFVYRPIRDFQRKYFHYLMRSAPYIAEYNRISKGVRTGQWDLDPVSFRTTPLLVPPLEQQQVIADFLDRETARIDKLIAKQERLVQMLGERRHAIVRRAVTSGVNKDAMKKQSSAPWLGDVPEHWVVTALGRRVGLLSGFPFKSEGFSHDETDWKLLRGVNINPGKTVWKDVVYWTRKPGDGLDDFELAPGDIVLGLDRPIVSGGVRAVTVSHSDTPSLLLQRVARIRPSPGLDSGFLNLLLSSQIFADYLAPIFTGVSVPHMSPEQLRKFTVAFPPLAEQRQIVAHVGDRERQILDLTRTAIAVVKALHERRQALISAAVTGKLEVGA
jgi:type I restriction enzyme S subunit